MRLCRSRAGVLLGAFVVVFVTSFCPRAHAAGADLSAELVAIRGANYTPSYASTSVGAWLHYDADVVERELAYAQRLRLNSVRVFLSTLEYEHDPQVFALATVARATARPSDDAAGCFELGLSIPHLFRLGKEVEAIAGYERLRQLARKWMAAE